MKVAIYARVSTERCTTCGHLKTDHKSSKNACKNCRCKRYQGQDAENQLRQLRQYATAQEWESREFIDYETGKHSNRAQMQALFTGATRREFDVVLVWALDRFTREGVSETFAHIKRLLDHGVQFESYSEAHFRTTGPAGELMIAIAAWIAKQERIRISERTKAGLARVKEMGTALGRPQKVFRRDLVDELRRTGKSWRAIAKQLGVSLTTVFDSRPKRRSENPSPAKATPKRKQRT